MKNKVFKFILLLLGLSSAFQSHQLLCLNNKTTNTPFANTLKTIKDHPYLTTALGVGGVGAASLLAYIKKSQGTNSSLSTIENGTPFTTHCLVIVSDNQEAIYNSSFSKVDLPDLFKKAALPILISSTILDNYLNIYSRGKNTLPANFHYFYLTDPENSGIKEKKVTQYILCIPKKSLPEDFKASQKQILEYELKLGLRFGALTIVPVEGADALTKQYRDDMPSLPTKDLASLIITKQEYKKANIEAPRWTILFLGHGSACESNKEKFEPAYSTAGLRPDNLIDTIVLFCTKTEVVYIDISSCFTGALQAAYLLKEIRQKTNANTPFILTTRTIHGDSPCTCAVESYQKFWETISMVKSCDNNNDYNHLYKALAHALAYIMPHNGIYSKELTDPAQDIALIKPAGKDYFVEFAELIPDKSHPFSFTARIDKKLLKNYFSQKDSNQNEITFPADRSRILLYTNSVPATICLNDDQALVSAIPGSTFHHIKKLELRQTDCISYLKNTLFTPTVTIKELLNKLMPVVGIKTEKLFLIDEVTNLTLPGIKKPLQRARLHISYIYTDSLGGAKLIVVITDLTNNTYYKLSGWKETEYFMNSLPYEQPSDRLKKITKTSAIEPRDAKTSIQEFENRITVLKKQAVKLQEYRPLKDADIEGLKQ